MTPGPTREESGRGEEQERADDGQGAQPSIDKSSRNHEAADRGDAGDEERRFPEYAQVVTVEIGRKVGVEDVVSQHVGRDHDEDRRDPGQPESLENGLPVAL
ncbi:MAG TPA: hypothetical protein VFE65_15395 [Pseudonocardia sp.]|jgi:hypothetical protein|nr:hypothetical protein [Pseudonocardia sp.]